MRTLGFRAPYTSRYAIFVATCWLVRSVTQHANGYTTLNTVAPHLQVTPADDAIVGASAALYAQIVMSLQSDARRGSSLARLRG